MTVSSPADVRESTVCPVGSATVDQSLTLAAMSLGFGVVQLDVTPEGNFVRRQFHSRRFFGPGELQHQARNLVLHMWWQGARCLDRPFQELGHACSIPAFVTEREHANIPGSFVIWPMPCENPATCPSLAAANRAGAVG